MTAKVSAMMASEALDLQTLGLLCPSGSLERLESLASDRESAIVLLQISLELSVFFTRAPSGREFLGGTRNLVLPSGSDDSLRRRGQTGEEIGYSLALGTFKAHSGEEILRLLGGTIEALFTLVDEDNLVEELTKKETVSAGPVEIWLDSRRKQPEEPGRSRHKRYCP